MTVTLINASGRLKVFVLPHETYCKARGRCACTVMPGREGRRIASSLSLAASARLEELDEAVLTIPEVERAARSGDLRVERKAPEPTRPIPSDASARRSGKKMRGDV